MRSTLVKDHDVGSVHRDVQYVAALKRDVAKTNPVIPRREPRVQAARRTRSQETFNTIGERKRVATESDWRRSHDDVDDTRFGINPK